MKFVHSETHRRHDPQFFIVRGQITRSTEQPERADRLLAAAQRRGHERVEARDFGEAILAEVHCPRYLDFLKNGYAQWRALPGASQEITPHVHPPREESGYPVNIIGRAGFHIADTSSPMGPHTWEAALAASHSACTAAQLVIEGAPAAYSLSRPPGHHATRDRAGGFCFLNHTAVAAQWLRHHVARVAILDVDVHHGNGTQDIFYERDDVLHVSLHADPAYFYPFFTGYAQETGRGIGAGCNLNLPLPIGTDDEAFLAALRIACRRVLEFKPDVVVVALGLDTYEGDPLNAFRITTPGFARIGQAIAGMALPTVLVQEGGYLSDELGENLATFLDGFCQHHRPTATLR
ncbi:histone deacetylase family protein [Bordetella genomosp. 6]|uniref:histone deacetylase family protein n=1 Tax=Bordetella genomosp. 6 TaxID=463024 RepID=UPI000A28E70B|nr:histone deacetylase family protein [Bordetella genomosp. 6]ARP78141.1 acetylpolyamine amidohydrolase [Bordetella genomosp. 6]